MKQLTTIGRVLYATGLVAVGIHQLLLKDFRAEILSPFPAWPHHYIVFAVLAGIALICTGIMISGLFKTSPVIKKNTCLYLGFCFLVLIITSQLPYILLFSPDKISRLDVWFNAGEELAYCGGAFVMAGSFAANNLSEDKKSFFQIWLERLVPLGRIFFAILILLFGCSHFVFTDFVATMVPKWAGAPLFWTYFAGIALIGSAIAILFKIWIKLAALLLAIMLFLFFIFFHVPDAIANPYTSHGNEIVRAIIALLFCGIALVISSTTK
jgi:uncharacterized membrane protein